MKQKMTTPTYDLEIIAGPCSVTIDNTEEIIHEIGAISVHGAKAIFGTRIVGLKSRTTLNPSGEGMGIDYKTITQVLALPENERAHLELPTLRIAEKVYKATSMQIATEVMLPHIQLPFFERSKLLKNNMLIWNPAVLQLGWNAYELGHFAVRNGWELGLKNSKFLGKQQLTEANHKEFDGDTSLEKAWRGMVSFIPPEIVSPILIHRGVDVPRNDDFRNALVHEIARRVKNQIPNARLYLDPSHSYGPKLREHIINGTVEAMTMKNGDTFLYDGVLIEAGTSPSDTEQHVTIKELQHLAERLSEFRTLRPPKQV